MKDIFFIDEKRSKMVDTLRVVCILLVIFMHSSYVPEKYFSVPNAVDTFNQFFGFFRMPLFFFLAGYSVKKFTKYNYFCEFIGKKIKVILFPYIFFLLTVNLLKYTLSSFTDNPIVDFNIVYLLREIVTPSLGFYWFLMALFIMFLFYPIYSYFLELNKYIILLLIAAFAIFSAWNFNVIEAFQLDKIRVYFVYFFIGAFVGNRYDLDKFDMSLKLSVFNSIVSWAIIFFSMNNVYINEIFLYKFLMACIGIFFIFNLCYIYIKMKLTFINIFYGKTYTIYLLHGIITMLSAGFLKKVAPDYWIYMVGNVVSAYFIPLIVIYFVYYFGIDRFEIVRLILGLKQKKEA